MGVPKGLGKRLSGLTKEWLEELRVSAATADKNSTTQGATLADLAEAVVHNADDDRLREQR